MMIDPVSAFAIASAAFNGIKKAVEIGKEAEEVYSQLSKWASAASDLSEAISQQENKKLGIFEKIGFAKNETTEAFDSFIAKQKLREMEQEIYHMFIYGDLQHLGIDGYREFVQTRRLIREKREKMIYDQMRRRQKFLQNLGTYGLAFTMLGIGLAFLTWLCILVYQIGLESGRW